MTNDSQKAKSYVFFRDVAESFLRELAEMKKRPYVLEKRIEIPEEICVRDDYFYTVYAEDSRLGDMSYIGFEGSPEDLADKAIMSWLRNGRPNFSFVLEDGLENLDAQEFYSLIKRDLHIEKQSYYSSEKKELLSRENETGNSKSGEGRNISDTNIDGRGDRKEEFVIEQLNHELVERGRVNPPAREIKILGDADARKLEEKLRRNKSIK